MYSRLSASRSVSKWLPLVVGSTKVRLLIGRLWGPSLVLGIFRQPEIGLNGLVCEED